MNCHYCTNPATKAVVWLKDKQGNPCSKPLPWCGCDLMAALKRFWETPYQIQESVDYRLGTLEELVEFHQQKHCDEELLHKIRGQYLNLTRQFQYYMNTGSVSPALIMGLRGSGRRAIELADELQKKHYPGASQ